MPFPALARAFHSVSPSCHALHPALPVDLSSTLLCPLVVSSALLCPCPAHHSVLCCHSPYSAVLPTVLIALRLLALCPQFSLYFVPPCPYFASTLTFTCLSFRPALNFVHALSSFCLLIAILPPSVLPFPPTSLYSAIRAPLFFLPSPTLHLTLPYPCLALHYGLPLCSLHHAIPRVTCPI